MNKKFTIDKWLYGIAGSLLMCWPSFLLIGKGWGQLATGLDGLGAALGDKGMLVMLLGFAMLLASLAVFCVCWSKSPNGTLYAVCMVLGALAWSALVIFTRRAEEQPSDTQVIRLAHWQLEPLVREGFDELMREYEQMRWQRDGLKVKIIQDPIPESTYGNWLSAQLMGGTAPDLIEIGLGLPANVLAGFSMRYFLMFTHAVAQPNPYNAGTFVGTLDKGDGNVIDDYVFYTANQFSNTAWRATYKDGMRTGYNEMLQEYSLVPLATFGTRIFYNKDLLKKLTGKSEPPDNWQDFKAMCKQIKAQRMPKKDGTPDPDGKFYTPIVGSQSHYPPWEGLLADPLSYGVIRMLDYTRDGWLSNTELYTAIQEGRVTFDIRPFQAKFRILEELIDFFQPGFTGLGRDEGVMLFIQQGAVFMTAGTWDQGGIRDQSKGIFEVGIINFPRPTQDDPDYGDVVEGPVFESSWNGFPFGLTRTSKHPELATDFMQYLASRDVNERLNMLIGWIPVIQDTEMSEDVKAFQPNMKGTRGGPPFVIGGDTTTRWDQLYSLFKVQMISIWEMLEKYTEYYKERGSDEYMEMVRNERRGTPGEERLIAMLRAQMVNAQQSGFAPERVALEEARYRRLMQNLTHKGFMNGLLMRIQQGNSPFEGDAYGMSSVAKEKVRERIKAELEGGKE